MENDMIYFRVAFTDAYEAEVVATSFNEAIEYIYKYMYTHLTNRMPAIVKELKDNTNYPVWIQKRVNYDLSPGVNSLIYVVGNEFVSTRSYWNRDGEEFIAAM